MAAAANSCDLIIYTAYRCPDMTPFINCLSMKGHLNFVGAVTEDSPPLSPFGIMMKDIKISGSHIGGPKLLKELVDFATSNKIRVPVEVVPFSEVNACLEKMRGSTHDGRFVLKW